MSVFLRDYPRESGTSEFYDQKYWESLTREEQIAVLVPMFQKFLEISAIKEVVPADAMAVLEKAQFNQSSVSAYVQSFLLIIRNVRGLAEFFEVINNEPQLLQDCFLPSQ